MGGGRAARAPGRHAAPLRGAARLAWAPRLLDHGVARAGLACCAAIAALACARGFGAMNPVAGDLTKPAVTWAVLVAVVNYKML